MQARDIMSTEVATVGPDTPTGDIARLLLARSISAVPVVDAAGAPIGMVSEGDLVGRSEAERTARRDWWLALLAEGEPLSSEFLASLRQPQRTARAVMSAPVVAIREATELPEIARLLAEFRIKRVPVLREGRIVGIVSRADLVRALAPRGRRPSRNTAGCSPLRSPGSIDRSTRRRGPQKERPPRPRRGTPAQPQPTFAT